MLYSPKCVEVEFCELRHNGVLRSSHQAGVDGSMRIAGTPTRARKERNAMTEYTMGTREQWLAARLELLEAEKELTRQR